MKCSVRIEAEHALLELPLEVISPLQARHTVLEAVHKGNAVVVRPAHNLWDILEQELFEEPVAPQA